MVIDYAVTTNPSSKYLAIYFTNNGNGLIMSYISPIWNNNPNFKQFIRKLIFIEIIERICMEIKFQKIKIKNSCRPVCKLNKYAEVMMNESTPNM